MTKVKKILLCAAIATSLSPTVSAATNAVVSSNVTGLQLWLSTTEMLTYENGGYFTDFKFGGTATDLDEDGFIDAANLTLTGVVGFQANGFPVRLTYDLGSGRYILGAGVTFDSGTVQIDVYSTGEWSPYNSIDATLSNQPFLAAQPGHLLYSGYGYDQTTAGIVSGTLPGLWNGQIGGAGFNGAVHTTYLLGFMAGMFIEGTLSATVLDGSRLYFSPAEVPVPGGAWLFGSALVGLAGWRRRRA
jgi:hypothetical protein